MEKIGRRYLVQIKYGADARTIDRIRETTPQIRTVLERLSGGNSKLAWTSADGSMFGFFMRTESSAKATFSALWKETPLGSTDGVMVLELGEDIQASGFSNTWAWLDRH